jgi:hypothetical protein
MNERMTGWMIVLWLLGGLDLLHHSAFGMWMALGERIHILFIINLFTFTGIYLAM